MEMNQITENENINFGKNIWLIVSPLLWSSNLQQICLSYYVYAYCE